MDEDDYDYSYRNNNFAKVIGHGKSPQIQVKTVDYQVRFTMDVNKQAFQQPFNLSLGKRLSEKMFLKDEFSDVKILCGGKTFPCHKAGIYILEKIKSYSKLKMEKKLNLGIHSKFGQYYR